MSSSAPRLSVIDAGATPEEVAAVVAAIAVLSARPAVTVPEPDPGSHWVAAARIRARRTGLSRGEWRLSGRIGRRARA